MVPVSGSVFGKAGFIDFQIGEDRGEPERDSLLDLDLEDRIALGQQRDAVHRDTEVEIFDPVPGCMSGKSI